MYCCCNRCPKSKRWREFLIYHISFMLKSSWHLSKIDYQLRSQVTFVPVENKFRYLFSRVNLQHFLTWFFLFVVFFFRDRNLKFTTMMLLQRWTRRRWFQGIRLNLKKKQDNIKINSPVQTAWPSGFAHQQNWKLVRGTILVQTFLHNAMSHNFFYVKHKLKFTTNCILEKLHNSKWKKAIIKTI